MWRTLIGGIACRRGVILVLKILAAFFCESQGNDEKLIQLEWALEGPSKGKWTYFVDSNVITEGSEIFLVVFACD
jgi:hypothetical protein